MPRKFVVHSAVNRRRFLGIGFLSVAALASPVARAATIRRKPPRSLAFHNLHTDERLVATYWADGRYRPGALAEINWLLRDFRTDEKIEIDVRLLDLLYDLRHLLGSTETFRVVSGYRSPATNAMLASRSGKVAKNSFHMQGMAVDVCLPDRDLEVVRDAAVQLGRGGVGCYPSSNFVHLDVGPVRSW